MNNNIMSSQALRVLNITLIVLFCLAIILPFFHVLAISFNSGIDAQKGGIGFWPREWSIENYTEVFKQDNLLNGLFISIFRTVVGTVVGVALMSMAAYAMTIKTMPGRKQITFFVFRIDSYQGSVSCCESQLDLKWVAMNQLIDYPFPEDNIEIIELIKRTCFETAI